MSEYHKAYYQKNKESIRKKSHEHYVQNRERICEAERVKLQELKKSDPEAYEAILKKGRERAARERASGKTRARQRAWESRNREKTRQRTNSRRQNQRITTIAAYGGKCNCCGESKIEFLGIDHINGGGAKHRRELSSGDRREFYQWLERQGFPKEFRVLCHNCNMSLGLYGYCPHQAADTDTGAVALNEIVISYSYL